MSHWRFFRGVKTIQLDLVGLLTVIGESAMAIHAQTVTQSWMCCVPRLITAPQAFLKPIRPTTLPPNTDATVIGIHSGNVKKHLNYFPSIMHDLDNYEKYSLTIISIKRKDRKGAESDEREICARLIGPVGILAGIGILLLVGLLGFAIARKDGTAVVALILLSSTSVLTGLGSKWKLQMGKRTAARPVPGGDVLVKDSRGAFLIVECEEDIARELYFSQETCDYLLRETSFRICSGIATFSLMTAVVFLANCTWDLQAAIGLTYILLNGAYWMGAVLPQSSGWRLDRYEVRQGETKIQYQGGKRWNYTDCLWEVGKHTKTMKWARRGDIVPDTVAWTKWIDEAEDECKKDPAECKWNYQRRLTELIEEKPTKVKGIERDSVQTVDTKDESETSIMPLEGVQVTSPK